MASENLIKIALRLAKSLGANEQKFLGTRSNVSFLGSGPQDGMLFQKSIDPEMISVIGQEKIIPAIESSMSYATGGKLNDLQINKLIDNMTVMKETFNPTNILKGDFGIDSLRAKSGIGERQLSEAAGDVKSIDDAAAGVNQADEAAAFPSFNTAENIDTSSPLMSKLKNRVQGIKDETEAASAIMKTIPKVDLPGKRASAREFLVNALKNENPNQTSFADIIDPADIKYIMEGGGGVEADPIVLVQKYFGPRVAELMPVGATTEQMAILTKRILENATDAKGLRPTDPDFDKFTLKLQESVKETPDGFPFAHGGRAGFKFGGLGRFSKAEVLIERLKNTIKDATGKTDELSVYVNETFPNFIKEIKADPKLANNENVWKNLGLELPKDQRLVVHSDDTVDFFRQHEGPGNIDRLTNFMEKHPFLTQEDALRIMKMEPEDQVLEITRLQILNRRTKNASGGLAKILEV
jgi:hypothetical protein